MVVTATPSAGPVAGAARSRPEDGRAWQLRVREHVDLWLHGFALLHADSSLVPYFRPGYRERALAARRGAASALDSESPYLRSHLEANPALVSAQFAALYFDSWEDLRQSAAAFVSSGGTPARAGDPRIARGIATFAAYFPTAADREWLERFLTALADERARFFGQYWREEQRRLGAAFDRADALWRTTYRARFLRYLTNARQPDGEVLVSLALAGEGRTLTGADRVNTVTVGMPSDSTSAEEVLFTFAHEIVGSAATSVVTDHTTPAEQRSGDAGRYASLAAVRGGAMLLRRIAPELVDGYQRAYLRWARVAAPAGPAGPTFDATFPLPDGLREALERQIDHILGGI